jgi:hypothetical protein
LFSSKLNFGDDQNVTVGVALKIAAVDSNTVAMTFIFSILYWWHLPVLAPVTKGCG